ncbi:MAG: HesA/MoeB/ThiF family protein [Planctomycetaceae bacterium]
MTDILKIDDQSTAEGRFSRFELIGWWDQERLRSAHVLVIGAGAIGNELIKNFALLGIGQLFVADLDLIENSNLSRSVLYREADCGHSKAVIAATRAKDIFPEMATHAFHGNIVYDLGLGVYRWADVIIGGLDNREARVAVNQSAAKLGKPWIDGAIERLDGVARVFHPATGPCYECTMSELDWKMLEARRSCALLTREQMEQGKVPTTPTTSSVIAGIQAQEAVKMLHGMPTLSGEGYIFEGTHHQSYLVTYTRQEECPSHESFSQIDELPWRASETRVGDLLDQARTDLGAKARIVLNQDLLSGLICNRCQKTEGIWTSLGKVAESQGRCPACGEHRAPVLYHELSAETPWQDKTLFELGIPAWDILSAYDGTASRHYELSGDKASVLGPLHHVEVKS